MFLTQTCTLADLELALETKEYTELSNLCDKNGEINTAKLQFALDRAYSLMDSYFKISGNCGRAMIQCAEPIMCIFIARYLLDTIKSRPQVERDYKEAMTMLKEARELNESSCPLSQEELNTLGFPQDLGFRFSTNNRRFTNESLRGLRNRSLSDNEYRRKLLSRFGHDCYGDEEIYDINKEPYDYGTDDCNCD